MKRGVFFFLWILTGISLRAQSGFMEPGSTGFRVMENLHRFHYDSARILIRKNQSRLSEGEYHFLLVNYYWWMMVSSLKPETYRDSLLREMNATDRLLTGTDTTDSRNYYIRLMNNGFRYRLAFKEERFLDGLKYANRTARNIHYALKHAEDSPFLKLTAAIYLFSTGWGEDRYWYLKPYFLTIPKGDTLKGLRYLTELTHHPNSVVADEAAYVALRIYKDMTHDYDKALPLARKLAHNNPENLFYLAVLIRIKKKSGLNTRNEENRYFRLWQQTRFVDDNQRQFYRRWQNIP